VLEAVDRDAAPLASGRERRRRRPAVLEEERLPPPVLRSQQVRTELAPVPLVGREHLALLDRRDADQVVDVRDISPSARTMKPTPASSSATPTTRLKSES